MIHVGTEEGMEMGKCKGGGGELDGGKNELGSRVQGGKGELTELLIRRVGGGEGVEEERRVYSVVN